MPDSTNLISVGTTNSPRITVDVPAFDIDSLPVTNGEFFEFVESGSYNGGTLWLPDDWKWKQLENRRYPNCWVKQDDEWLYPAMFDHLPLPKVASWPVSVSLANLGHLRGGGVKDCRRRQNFIVLLVRP